MEKLLNALQDVLKLVNQAIAEVTKLIADYNTITAKLAEDKEALTAHSQELDKREAEIKKIENVQGLKQEAERQLKEARDEFAKLGRERDAFNDYVSNKNRELSLAIKKNEEETKQLQAEWEILKKEQAIFEKEKEEYKANIAKKLIDLADKK